MVTERPGIGETNSQLCVFNLGFLARVKDTTSHCISSSPHIYNSELEHLIVYTVESTSTIH